MGKTSRRFDRKEVPKNKPYKKSKKKENFRGISSKDVEDMLYERYEDFYEDEDY